MGKNVNRELPRIPAFFQITLLKRFESGGFPPKREHLPTKTGPFPAPSFRLLHGKTEKKTGPAQVLGLAGILPGERGKGIMTPPNQSPEAIRRVDREPARSHKEWAATDSHDSRFLPPHADQFRITDLQLWIDLSA